MKRIFRKIFLAYLVVIVVLTTTILYFSFSIIKENHQNNLIENLLNINNPIDRAIVPLLLDSNMTRMDSLVKVIGNDIKVRITIINNEGIVLADSQKEPSKMQNHSDRPEVIKAFALGKGSSIRYSSTVKKDMLYVAVPIKVNGKLLGVSRLAIYMDDFDDLISNLRVRILQIVFIVVIISLILAIIFSRNITKPIADLVLVSKAVAGGDFEVKAIAETNDELKLLADSFNNMIDKIRYLFQKTNRQKEELINIISSIQEGIVVIDNEGKIKLTNQSFNKIVNNESAVGMFYWEIIREPAITKIVKKLKDSDKNRNTEIILNDEYYICNASHINDRKEIVLSLYNISHLKKLENIKKEFVANVSHELKTPLTVIKGYIETIEEEIDEKNKKYLNIIKNHTNRLIDIVQDLLTVSKLEDNNIKLDISEFKLKPFFANVYDTFEQRLKNKNLYLKINLADENLVLEADEYKLEQLFTNLIENAVKYSEQGGITISAVKENSGMRFEVADTGIGIPDSDIGRVFERFYTVDKSRARNYAGTGLGLSIVKHIVNLHKGSITVESKYGTGTKFVILIPLIGLNSDIT
ncbi:MAG: ATP-binding protein [Candidatus Kapabacteria bacterium]|nr:ATP-binding protein [Candidatus Kapabacteria bacterium]